MKKIDKDEFIRRSKIHHGDNYDYSLVNYKNNRTKVFIICKKHGNFEQIPESHMKGFGCSKCSNNYNPTNDEFIEKLKVIFGNKINYDRIEYKSQNHKVTINCSEHGDSLKFTQSLLRGSGCNKCEIKNFKIDRSLFTERANIVHNFKYDYSSLEYTNDRTKVKIICKEHGLFFKLQTLIYLEVVVQFVVVDIIIQIQNLLKNLKKFIMINMNIQIVIIRTLTQKLKYYVKNTELLHKKHTLTYKARDAHPARRVKVKFL